MIIGVCIVNISVLGYFEIFSKHPERCSFLQQSSIYNYDFLFFFLHFLILGKDFVRVASLRDLFCYLFIGLSGKLYFIITIFLVIPEFFAYVTVQTHYRKLEKDSDAIIQLNNNSMK